MKHPDNLLVGANVTVIIWVAFVDSEAVAVVDD